jgi:RAB6A-GEF complex partner protein 1
MQILADRLEFCWIHLRGIGALENSLWGYDGKGMRVWLNALAIEASNPAVEGDGTGSRDVRASAHIPLDFYPLCESIVDAYGVRTGVNEEMGQPYSWTRA